MAGVYYTNITIGQANKIVAMVKNNKIKLTNNMIKYIYALVNQGGGFARDTQEEIFRQKIIESIDRMMTYQRDGIDEAEACRQAEEKIINAFRVLCSYRTGAQLKLVKMELEDIEKNRVRYAWEEKM